MKKFYIAVFFLSFFTSPSFAFTGNRLLQISGGYERELSGTGDDARDHIDFGVLIGYVVGATDVLTRTKKVSLPDGVTTNQLCLIFIKYLKETPQYLHLQGDILLEIALNRAFKPNLPAEKGSEVEAPKSVKPTTINKDVKSILGYDEEKRIYRFPEDDGLKR